MYMGMKRSKILAGSQKPLPNLLRKLQEKVVKESAGGLAPYK